MRENKMLSKLILSYATQETELEWTFHFHSLRHSVSLKNDARGEYRVVGWEVWYLVTYSAISLRILIDSRSSFRNRYVFWTENND